MTTYVYKAKKKTAETVTGHIKAQSHEEAVELINQLGLLPVMVEQDVDAERFVVTKQKKVDNKELCVFSRQLANLLKSGVTLLNALDIIEGQTHNGYFKGVIAHIGWGIKSGKSFSECLRNYSRIFSPLYLTMIRAGEESGNLQEMLRSVASYQRKQQEIVSKVRLALVYPSLIVSVGLVTVYFILTFVLPKMIGLFENIQNDLPLPTVILLNVSDTLNHYWLPVLAGIAGLILIGTRWKRSQSGRFISSRFLLRMPLFGQIVLKSELARFARALILLLKGGVSLVGSLQTAIPIMSNELIKKDLTQCKEDLMVGKSLGESLRKSQEIPAMMSHLIAVGEEAGNINDVLAEIAETYEEETDERIKMMTTLLEPLLILFVGLIIGFIVFSMLLPIFQIDILAQ